MSSDSPIPQAVPMGGAGTPHRRRGGLVRALCLVATLALTVALVPVSEAVAEDIEPSVEQQRAEAAAAAEAAAESPDGDDAMFGLAQASGVTGWSGGQSELDVIVEALVDDAGVDVRGAAFTGANRALGTYEGLITGSPATSTGVIISTGDVADAGQSEVFASTPLAEPGDDRLEELVDGPTFDAAVLEFEFRNTQSQVSFDFQFASEEFPDFVGSVLNDVFAFDINGDNCALTPDGALISVNTTEFRPAPGLAYGGISQLLTCTRTLPVNQWHTARLAIADTSDDIFDSAVLLGGGTLRDSLSALRGEASADLAVPAFSGAHGLQRQGFELVGEVA